MFLKQPLLVFFGLLMISVWLMRLINTIPGTSILEIALMLIVMVAVVYFGMRLWAKSKGMPNPFDRKK